MFPVPNWPSSLFPQQYRLLFVSTEQVCHCPAATADATDPVMVPLNSLLVIRVYCERMFWIHLEQRQILSDILGYIDIQACALWNVWSETQNQWAMRKLEPSDQSYIEWFLHILLPYIGILNSIQGDQQAKHCNPYPETLNNTSEYTFSTRVFLYR